LLSGSLPFDHASQQETIKQTLNAPLIFDLPSWKTVSDNGKDFISQLLKKDPKLRMTIDKALVHPWLRDHVKK
jgi:serine/threonine protein kinase